VYYLYENIFMITKEKNVALNLSIPKDLKEEFVRFAYDLWTNPTNLLKMFMKQAITTRQINFRSPIIWVERFNNEELTDLTNDEEIKDWFLRLNKVFT
jgi:antitoxin component of RelBE/YafQ-DinJ toxin-antitoxin module